MELGTIVALTTGGPRMTVVETRDDAVRCEWEDEGKMVTRWFLLECVAVMVKVENSKGVNKWVKASDVPVVAEMHTAIIDGIRIADDVEDPEQVIN